MGGCCFKAFWKSYSHPLVADFKGCPTINRLFTMVGSYLKAFWNRISKIDLQSIFHGRVLSWISLENCTPFSKDCAEAWVRQPRSWKLAILETLNLCNWEIRNLRNSSSGFTWLVRQKFPTTQILKLRIGRSGYSRSRVISRLLNQNVEKLGISNVINMGI